MKVPKTTTLIVLLVSAALIALVAAAALLARPPDPGTGIEVGQFAPEFTILDVNGTAWTVSAHRGQVVLLDFMGARCQTCEVEMGEGSMQSVQAQYASRGFTIISIDVGGVLGTKDPMEAWRFVAGLNPDGSRRWGAGTWPVALDNQSLATTFGVVPLPQKFLLDGTGKIAWKQTGLVTQSVLQAQVAALLG